MELTTIRILQLFRSNQQPLTVVLNKLLSQAATKHRQFWIGMDQERFQLEMRLIRNTGKLELPPSTVFSMRKLGKLQTMECAGFTITNRFPNNVVVVRDVNTSFGYKFVWITRFEQPDPGTTKVRVVGRVFQNVRELTTVPVSSRHYGVFVVSAPKVVADTFDMSRVSAKAMAFHTDALVGRVNPEDPLIDGRSWIIDIIDYLSL